MKKIISLEGIDVPYTVKRYPRSRGIRMSMSHERELRVSAPEWVPNYFIERAIKEKEAWIFKTLAYFSSPAGGMPNATRAERKALYKKHKEEARDFVLRRLEHFNHHYRFPWNAVNIRNQKTRWGSCSKKRNLNFHFKLALVPKMLADYVVVHELCHLKEFNHGSRFWDLVAQTIPDYNLRRKELRSHQL